ncbi:Golgi SNAP receptor complex member 1 [Aphelenchoides besseyi]|nr:Golgi SNAP receptor complex member 1 [Aphelenchoides besseyi]
MRLRACNIRKLIAGELKLATTPTVYPSIQLPVEKFGQMEVSWSDLRTNATALEREIDELLAKVNGFLPSSGLMNMNSGQIAVHRQAFDKTSADLDVRLSRLMNINEQMAAYLNAYEQNGVYDQSMRSLYFRHRETFRSYCSEFSRSQSNISSELKRAELLAGGAAYEPSALSNRAKSSDYLLKENDRINSCDRLLDEQIHIAIGVKESLHTQRMGMSDINKKLHQLSKKYPAIGSLMQKIRAKKRKDTIILAAVIVSCFIFLFFYMMH